MVNILNYIIVISHIIHLYRNGYILGGTPCIYTCKLNPNNHISHTKMSINLTIK